jgi:quercetin dioxygenase-like cupin family protein
MFLRQLPLTLLTLAMIFPAVRVAAQDADQPIISPAAGAKFSAVPNAPACFTIAVEKGDPSKGSSVILAKFAPGCVAPFHWHTPGETAMVVNGSLETQMQGDKALVAHRGDFLFLPPHHVHRATCQGSAACLVFLSSDAAFDIHWVDPDGKEISLEQAIKAAKAPGAQAKK